MLSGEPSSPALSMVRRVSAPRDSRVIFFFFKQKTAYEIPSCSKKCNAGIWSGVRSARTVMEDLPDWCGGRERRATWQAGRAGVRRHGDGGTGRTGATL